MYSFQEQNNKDFVKEAENRCYEYLKAAGHNVANVAQDPKWFELGVDLILNDKIYIDVKADTRIHKTANIFYELIECFYENGKEKMGWGLNKNIHYIYYVDAVNWILYILPMHDLKSYVYNKIEFASKLITHNNYKTIGLLLPLSEMGKFTTTVILNQGKTFAPPIREVL